MEFGEKLQQLRKSRGLTQEELASALFVSRTAVSKWESGKGYPGIDSLKEIATFFSVSIDELLTSEKIILIAENEGKLKVKEILWLIFGAVDILAVLGLVLPLYPIVSDTFVYSADLLSYTGIKPIAIMYWVLFSALALLGVLNIIFSKIKANKVAHIVRIASLATGILAVAVLSLARLPYAAILAFVLLLIKALLIFKTK